MAAVPEGINSSMTILSKDGYPMSTSPLVQIQAAEALKKKAVAPKKTTSTKAVVKKPDYSSLVPGLEQLLKSLQSQSASAINASKNTKKPTKPAAVKKTKQSYPGGPMSVMGDNGGSMTTIYGGIPKTGANTSAYTTDFMNTRVANDTSSTPEGQDFSFASIEEETPGIPTPEPTRSPTVFSNEQVIQDVIPQLNSQASSLPTFGAANSGMTSAGGGDGGSGDIDISEVLGIGTEEDGKKKKKKDWEQYQNREGTEYALPSGYWEGMYGESAQEMKRLADLERENTTLDRQELRDIRKKYDQRRTEQETANASGLANVKQALALGGSSRYAPISSQGIISAQEQAGIRALSALDSQEMSAITTIKTAQADRNWKVVQEQLGVLEDIRTAKTDTMKALQGAAQQNQYQSSRDNQIAGLVAQGITDPVEMLQTLNGQGGDFTFEEITGALSGLNEVGGKAVGNFKFDAKQIGPMLGAGLTVQDIQDLQTYIGKNGNLQEALALLTPEEAMAVKGALGIDEAKAGLITPGVGANDQLGEQMIRTRIFPKAAAILNKGTLSDADREIIDERIDYFRNNNLSEQQILDVFSGWSQDVNSPYNSAFRDIIIGNDTDGQGTSPTLSRVGSLLANGNNKGAMKAVENMAMTKAKELDPDGYLSDAAAQVYTKRIDRIKQLLAKSTDYGNTGFIEGNFNKVLGKLKGAEAQNIKSELTQLYQTFRKENAGVAVSDAEQRFLDQLFADINDPKGNFVVKLDTFQNGILDRYNATRSSVGLPKARVLDILDENERLYLYGDPNASALDGNSLDI